MGYSANASQFNLFSIRYSTFLGVTYLANEVYTAVKSEMLPVITEDTWKLGYSPTVSPKAVNDFRSKGVNLNGKMNGVLTGVRVKEKDVQGRPTPYLSATVTDGNDKFNLSIAIAEEAATDLIRRLINCKPGVETSIGLFALMKKADSQGRVFPGHFSTVFQDGVKIERCEVGPSLNPQIEASMAALTAAGIPETDTATRQARRSAIQLAYFTSLAKQVELKFADYFEEPGDDNTPM